MPMNMATGTVEGTGSAINVSCGFTPLHVKLVNIDGDAMLEWAPDMGAAGGYKTIADGTSAHVATGGVSAYVGAVGTASNGFTIGADSDVNASGETLVWVAYGA